MPTEWRIWPAWTSRTAKLSRSSGLAKRMCVDAMSLTLSLQQTSQVGQIRSNRVDRPPSREPIGERITYSRHVADCTQPGGREIRTDADSTPLTGCRGHVKTNPVTA